jgi:hypothetical protein
VRIKIAPPLPGFRPVPVVAAVALERRETGNEAEEVGQTACLVSWTYVWEQRAAGGVVMLGMGLEADDTVDDTSGKSSSGAFRVRGW